MVAEEIRKLAEQSGGAAQKIAELICSIQEDTNKTVVSMQKNTEQVERGGTVKDDAGRSFIVIEQCGNELAIIAQDVAKELDVLAKRVNKYAT